MVARIALILAREEIERGHNSFSVIFYFFDIPAPIFIINVTTDKISLNFHLIFWHNWSKISIQLMD